MLADGPVYDSEGEDGDGDGIPITPENADAVARMLNNC